ncbi:MAG: hypothetical protein COU08_02020 [Candidatus Harrisonbacteria bacterium CG10_big_fil_rev_8_21_14_0_10_42_17]|uniref:Uncharacterized protein n=1 Tax=Candidatus Harrisonbacteria bacterium CG10_big_fil_rev_8_21_14_0_10_42_17 TaxID=1974584 RepID=A0A2M6WIB6_9BACT|nr:MAG: hypothetical protein COU08_02020 [Candidatus Harrisonbacteria bacterium CG10_big_fil_rev_8_21_14_0_10_42_17]
MEEKYAHTILKLIHAGMEPSDAVSRIHKMLQEKGRIGLWPSIKRAFIRLVQAHAQKEDGTLLLPVGANKEEVAIRAGVLLSDVEIKEDETLIGGWIFKKGSTLVDASYKTQLKQLYTQATK